MLCVKTNPITNINTVAAVYMESYGLSPLSPTWNASFAMLLGVSFLWFWSFSMGIFPGIIPLCKTYVHVLNVYRFGSPDLFYELRYFVQNGRNKIVG